MYKISNTIDYFVKQQLKVTVSRVIKRLSCVFPPPLTHPKEFSSLICSAIKSLKYDIKICKKFDIIREGGGNY